MVWMCQSDFTCHGKWTGQATTIPSTDTCASALGPGVTYMGSGTGYFPDGVTMLVDWRDDLSMEYFNYAAVTIDYATGAIASDDESVVFLSDTNLNDKGPGTYVYYNSTTYRTDLFHVYSQPGVYPATLRVLWSVDGQSVESHSNGCICPGEDYYNTCESDGSCHSGGFQMCESGDAFEDSHCMSYPLYIGQSGTCSTPFPPESILERFSNSPLSWVVGLVSVALAVILIRRCQTRQKESLLDQPFHGESGLNQTAQIS